MTAERLPKILETIDAIAATRRKRIPTPALNKFVEAVTAANPPVSPQRRHVRILAGRLPRSPDRHRTTRRSSGRYRSAEDLELSDRTVANAELFAQISLNDASRTLPARKSLPWRCEQG